MSQSALLKQRIGVAEAAAGGGRRARRSRCRWSTRGSPATLAAAITSLDRSSALATFSSESPVGSTKCALRHAELARLGVHRRHARGEAARVVAAKRVRRTVLRGHESEVHQVAARQVRAEEQTRETTLAAPAILGRDGNRLIERLAGLRDHERRHQLGDRGDRHGDVRAPRVQDRGAGRIEHQCRARAQRRCVEARGPRVGQADAYQRAAGIASQGRGGMECGGGDEQAAQGGPAKRTTLIHW